MEKSIEPLGAVLSRCSGKTARMWVATTLITVLWLTLNRANAFALDGLFSGMTREQATQRLRETGFLPRPTGSHDEVVGGVYTLGFCGGRLNFVSKEIDVREFNGYLADTKRARGPPIVEIPSLDDDMLWLRWFDDGKNRVISLNSGMDGRRRFHLIVELDNTVCPR